MHPRSLLGATHPLPTVAVTVLATVVAAAAGRSAAGCVLVAAAVLTGQLSIGWLNDLLDRDRDLAAARRDKPLVTGLVSPRQVATSCAVAVTACVPLSLASGLLAGLVHLVAVAGGWAYDLGLKRTALSWLPYAASFGLLTAFLTLGLPGHPAPPWWLVTAGALLGTGAHFLNVVPDVEHDLAAGIRGLPQRLGAARSAVAGAVLLAAAVVVVTLGPGRPPWWAWLGSAVACGSAAAAGMVGAAGTSRRTPFALAVGTAAVAVLLLVARAPELG
jgi:4-hydroxybenzoate polyprenyltransferase